MSKNQTPIDQSNLFSIWVYISMGYLEGRNFERSSSGVNWPGIPWVETNVRLLKQRCGLQMKETKAWFLNTRGEGMWTGSNLGVEALSGMSFVVGVCPCSEGFSLSSPVFLPPQNPTFPNSNSAWKQWMNTVDMPLQINVYSLFSFSFTSVLLNDSTGLIKGSFWFYKIGQEIKESVSFPQ